MPLTATISVTRLVARLWLGATVGVFVVSCTPYIEENDSIQSCAALKKTKQVLATIAAPTERVIYASQYAEARLTANWCDESQVRMALSYEYTKKRFSIYNVSCGEVPRFNLRYVYLNDAQPYWQIEPFAKRPSEISAPQKGSCLVD